MSTGKVFERRWYRDSSTKTAVSTVMLKVLLSVEGNGESGGDGLLYSDDDEDDDEFDEDEVSS